MVFCGIFGYLGSYGIICDMKYIPVLNNYLEHNLDNHRVNFSKVLACKSFMLQLPLNAVLHSSEPFSLKLENKNLLKVLG